MADSIDLAGETSKTLFLTEDTELKNLDFLQNITNTQIRLSESKDFADDNLGFIINPFDGYRSSTNDVYVKPLKANTTIILQVQGT